MKLAKKGINFIEIKFQTNNSEEKIAEVDKKIEKLPDVTGGIIIKYIKEKDEKLRTNQYRILLRIEVLRTKHF